MKKRLAEQRAALFTSRYLFVQRHLNKTERKTLWRVSRGWPQLQKLRAIMEQVYALFDPHSTEFSGAAAQYCVNFKGCTRLINATGTLPSQRMLMFARPRLDIVEPLHIPVHLVSLSY